MLRSRYYYLGASFFIGIYMSYQTVSSLANLWSEFKPYLKNILDSNNDDTIDIAEIEKLITAEFVVDFSLHEIYEHATGVRKLTEKLIALKGSEEADQNIDKCCAIWLNLLKQRNQIPLQLKHHKRMDGECDFRFSLQLMEGKRPKFDKIEILDAKNDIHLNEAIKSIHRLECIATGISFADLPLMGDKVLSALLEYKDSVCLVAKDDNGQIVGHCWGVIARDVSVSKDEKANVFWIMNLARDPDFYDPMNKIGERLREKMIEVIKARSDCDFVGYQHVIGHKFHHEIIGEIKNDDEDIRLNSESYSAKTNLKYHDDMAVFVRAHFIRANDKTKPYPEYETIEPAIIKVCWRAAHSVKDFIVGGAMFFGRNTHQKLTQNMLSVSVDHRLNEHLTQDQIKRDTNVLKEIVSSDLWSHEGKGLFHANRIPGTIRDFQSFIKDGDLDFIALKAYVDNHRRDFTRSKLTSLLCGAINVSDTPTFALNVLLKDSKTPKEWVDMISARRVALLKEHRNTA